MVHGPWSATTYHMHICSENSSSHSYTHFATVLNTVNWLSARGQILLRRIKFIFVEYSGALNCNESRPDRMSAKTAVLALNFAASAFNSNQMPKVLAVCISLNCISICVNCGKHSCWFLFVHSLPATCSHHSIQCVPFLGSDTNIVQPDAFIQTRTLALYIL